MTGADSPLSAGPILGAQVADACGLDWYVVNDELRYVIDESGEWRTFHPSTDANTARAAAVKAGLAGVSGLPATATAPEICAAILRRQGMVNR